MNMTATAYTAECDGCSGITYTGLNLNEDRHKKVIAVDPNVIPLGTRVHVEGYGEAIAGDIGSAIKGNKIDIHVPTKDEAFSWGVREVVVTILDRSEEHTSELQSRGHLVCRLLLEKKKKSDRYD